MKFKKYFKKKRKRSPKPIIESEIDPIPKVKSPETTAQKSIIIKNPNNLPLIDWKIVYDLQGDFKTITDERLAKLKRTIIKHGFDYPIFLWLDDEKTYWILDGHQRIRALESLEKDGFKIDNIPYCSVEAKTKKEAAEKILYLNSVYGEINPDTSFFDDFGLDLADLDVNFDIDFNFSLGDESINSDLDLDEDNIESVTLRIHKDYYAEVFDSLNEMMNSYDKGIIEIVNI